MWIMSSASTRSAPSYPLTLPAIKMKRRLLSWSILLTLTATSVHGQTSSYLTGSKENNFNDSLQSPLFNAVDIKGDSIILNHYLGKVVVLNFWYTLCVPCIAEIPDLNYLVNKYKDKEVIFVAITQDSKQQVQTFFEKKNTTFLYLQVTDGADIIKQYVNAPLKAKGFDEYAFTDIRPANIIIDKSGLVNKYFFGGLGGHINILENNIEKILNEK